MSKISNASTKLISTYSAQTQGQKHEQGCMPDMRYLLTVVRFSKFCPKIMRPIFILIKWNLLFLTFHACFSIQYFFSNLNLNCSNLSSLRNLQEQVEKAFCYQELFWPFTVWINCSSDLIHFANSWPSASNFKSFSRSLEPFFLTVG